MIYTHVAAALVGAALAATGTWQVQEWRAQKKELAQTKLVVRQLENAHAETIKLQSRVDSAQQAATLRERRLAADRSRLVALNNGLRDELAAARSVMPDATCDSLRQYATTLSSVYGSCRERLVEMGLHAQGHAIDSQKLIDGWPGRNGASVSQPERGATLHPNK